MEHILGNESLKEHFMSAIRHGKVSHAYIIEGERGSGKKTMADGFARLLQCENLQLTGASVKACGTCPACIMMDHLDHPDVIRVSHEKPNVIRVDEVRGQLVNTVDVMPYKGPYKIYIIDEAEKMNPAAQNALLKSIEEPPPYAVIMLLTSSRGAFLPTILSRCILLSMKPLPDAQVRDYLTERCGAAHDLAEFVAGFAMGNIGRAREAASSEDFIRLRDLGLSVLRYIYEMEDYQIAGKVKELKEWKNQIGDYLDMMRIWFRDILVLKALGSSRKDARQDRSGSGRKLNFANTSAGELIYKNEYTHISRQSQMLDFEGLNHIMGLIDQAAGRIRANVNFETVMELLHMEIRNQYITAQNRDGVLSSYKS